MIHLPGFYVAATRPDKGTASVPLLVSRGATVLDASAEALEKGVVVGMPVRRALRLVSAVVEPEDASRTAPFFRQVWDVVASHTPLIETRDHHEGFADLTGCLRRGEPLAERAELLRAQITAETGLRARIGGGSTCASAQLAARQSPDGFLPRTRSDERRFLREFPVSGCSGLFPDALLQRLPALGVRTLGDVAALPPERVMAIAGRADGWRLWRLSRREETRALRPTYPPEAITVAQGFLPPTDEESRIVALLERLSATANARLCRAGMEARTLSLTLHLAGGERRHQEVRFPRKSTTALAAALRAERLFRDVWRGEEVEKIVLSLGALVPRVAEQVSLWGGAARRRRDDVRCAVERTQARFGARSLAFASEDDAEFLLPPPRFAAEAFMQAELCPRGAGWYA
jgi:DNA polymerase-4